jgi:hypothetical protein
MGKLPSDLGAQVFADSPLRPTAPPKNPPLTAVPAPAVSAPLPSIEMAAVVHQVAPREAAPPPATGRLAAAGDAAPVQQIKMTVYLSKEQVDAIEEEVFRRRRAGERIGNTDLMREIVDAWRSR